MEENKSYLGWKSWLGAGDGVGLELLMMMREARNRKSSSSCWISDGPARKESPISRFDLLAASNSVSLVAESRARSPRCSFSLPHSDSRVLIRRRCPARRMLSASLVSISEVQLGSKLSSQEISSSSMVAVLTLITSISEAAGEGSTNVGLRKPLSQSSLKFG